MHCLIMIATLNDKLCTEIYSPGCESHPLFMFTFVASFLQTTAHKLRVWDSYFIVIIYH